MTTYLGKSEHPPSLIRVIAVRFIRNQGSMDQTSRMPRLVI